MVSTPSVLGYPWSIQCRYKFSRINFKVDKTCSYLWWCPLYYTVWLRATMALHDMYSLGALLVTFAWLPIILVASCVPFPSQYCWVVLHCLPVRLICYCQYLHARFPTRLTQKWPGYFVMMLRSIGLLDTWCFFLMLAVSKNMWHCTTLAWIW
jgi:hypothetical protein